jgi:hypothetical protein
VCGGVTEITVTQWGEKTQHMLLIQIQFHNSRIHSKIIVLGNGLPSIPLVHGHLVHCPEV